MPNKQESTTGEVSNKDTLKESEEWTEWRKKASEAWWNYWNYQGAVPDRDFIEKFWTDYIETLIEQERQAERERVVKIINDATNYDHSKCPIKQTCVGYQSCVSDIMNALSQNTTQEEVTKTNNG